MHLNNYAEAARLLRLSESSLRHWVARGEVPYVKLGRRVFFTEEQIQEIIQSRIVGPSGVVEMLAEGGGPK